MKNILIRNLVQVSVRPLLGLSLIITLLSSILPHRASAQTYQRPAWMFGLSGGANFNFYRGTTQVLNDGLTTPTAFHNGNGIGLFIAPLVEYRNPNSSWGFGLQAGYDNRQGSYDRVITSCNCPADLSADISYITVEPTLRFAPGKSDFHLFAGPRIAVVRSKSFEYTLGRNPDFPQQEIEKTDGEFSKINKTLFSLHLGAGYDIPLSSPEKSTQFILEPFVSYHPYFGQDPRTNETWNVNTLRVGMAFKVGKSKMNDNIAPPVQETAQAKMVVKSPPNDKRARNIKETFPLRNYVFFNSDSEEIPSRYILLNKSEVKNFREDQLPNNKATSNEGRSARQLSVYYNLINIIGARMIENPSANITLVGSAPKDPATGKKMAENVKEYLVDVFEITSGRIRTEGRGVPEIPSEQSGGKRELALLREGDRRVSIESYPVLCY